MCKWLMKNFFSVFYSNTEKWKEWNWKVDSTQGSGVLLRGAQYIYKDQCKRVTARHKTQT